MGIASSRAGAGPEQLQPFASLWRSRLRRFLRRKTAVAGVAILVLLILAALLAEPLAPYDPTALNLGEKLTAPGARFWLGLDSLGRDMLSRIIYGARISLGVGLAVTAIAVVFGTLLGLIGGYYRAADLVLQRVNDALLAFPPILLAMALMAALGADLRNVVIALGIVYTPRYARIIRGSVLSVRERDYIQAAKALGARDARILFSHVLPNVTAPILVQASFIFGQSIIAEAALSFLGIGTQPPTPSWGLMLADAKGYLTQAFWYPLVPGTAIALSVLAVNLVGDALRDVLDPNLKHE